eukprot:scaffold209767_cov32-Prasinocladus_malaysianus.AAC.1
MADVSRGVVMVECPGHYVFPRCLPQRWPGGKGSAGARRAGDEDLTAEQRWIFWYSYGRAAGTCGNV